MKKSPVCIPEIFYIYCFRSKYVFIRDRSFILFHFSRNCVSGLVSGTEYESCASAACSLMGVLFAFRGDCFARRGNDRTCVFQSRCPSPILWKYTSYPLLCISAPFQTHLLLQRLPYSDLPKDLNADRHLRETVFELMQKVLLYRFRVRLTRVRYDAE